MKHSADSPLVFNEGFSLVEVLMAVAVIAVAVYGMILTLAAQQLGDSQLRDSKVLRNLHYQLVREVLKNQREQDANNILTTVTSSAWQLATPALGNDNVYLTVTANGNSSYTSQLYTLRNGNKIASSSLTLLWPYIGANNDGSWKSVKP